MDRPHSVHSPHNFRTVKAGPQSLKYIDLTPKSARPKLAEFSKQSKRSTGSFGSLNRPIATNSRIKQDELQRKDMFASFVNDALTRHASGDSEPFNQLVSEFDPSQKGSNSGDKAEPIAQRQSRLRLWLSALSHVVSRLERVHSPLVQAIADMPWTIMESATVKSYTIFMGMLLSARPEYLSLILSKIAQGLTFQPLPISPSPNPEAENIQSLIPITRRTIYDRQHYLLQHLLSVIPTLSTTLVPFLSKNFPHKRQSEGAHTVYIRNLLRIGSYCPEIADSLLGIIMDRVVRIDVEIQVDIEDLEESDPQPLVGEEMFEFDFFDNLIDQEESTDDSSDDEEDNFSDISSDAEGDLAETRSDMEAPQPELPMNVRHIRDMVKKLDAVLLLMFQHFDRIHQQASGSVDRSEPELGKTSLPPLPPVTPSIILAFEDIPDPPTPSQNPSASPFVPPPAPQQAEATDGLLPHHHTLLALFERLLLPTFKSRYTQFLLFQSAAQSPAFADLFLGLLLERALYQDNVPAVTRAAAASYIASFVSRAQFVSRDTTRTVVGVLCDYLANSLSFVESGTGAIGGQDMPTFYAVVQAMFLIFCFRWRDLKEDQTEGETDDERKAKKWMKDLNVMHRVVNSVLNPLQVCSQNVVQQFSRVAQHTDFVYCYTIMESNTRHTNVKSGAEPETRRGIKSNPTASGNGLLDVTAELNTFFPFDPYKLPRSSKYVQDVYREWGEVAIGDDEDEEEEDEELEDEPHGTPIRASLDVPKPPEDDSGLGASLDAMSISPQRRLLVR